MLGGVIETIYCKKVKVKVHPCAGTEALYLQPIGGVDV